MTEMVAQPDLHLVRELVGGYVCQAQPRHAGLLAALSQCCFPRTWPWCAPLWYRTRLWKATLGSNSCETYIAILDNDNAPAGFAVLVVDEPLWNAERMDRYGAVSLRAIAALQRPLHGLRLAAKHTRLVVARRASPPQGPGLSRPAVDRVFLGTIGVVPESRRRGIARALMDVREARARQLRRAMAWCMIDPGNLAAERFHAACGYKQVQTSAIGTTWERVLS